MLLISMEMAAGRSLWRQDREDHGQLSTRKGAKPSRNSIFLKLLGAYA